ncbi:hypothetical protein [Candidatus Villigracilis affinis]|uniref:hypothetical protein n=1 Tax=Candidatus Villigracilis affinis TaxID=3140682 RepID=UPI0031E89205
MLSIMNNGLTIEDGNLRYAWFELQKDLRRFFRCVALRELKVIPVSVREDYDLLGKQWAAVRGLHNAGVNFVYTAMGIYAPDHIGIVQFFGAAGEADSLEDAAKKALIGTSTVEAVLANFPQSQLGAPNPDWLQWYLDFITARGCNIAAVLGHPDPRQGKRGTDSEGTIGDDSDEDLAEEQNEILFRGLSKLRQNFVFQVLAEHIARARMTQTLMRISEAASNVGSRRKGAIGIGFNLGIPIMAALSQSNASGVGVGQGTAHSAQDGVSQGWGNSHTVGRAFARHNHIRWLFYIDGYKSWRIGWNQPRSFGWYITWHIQFRLSRKHVIAWKFGGRRLVGKHRLWHKCGSWKIHPWRYSPRWWFTQRHFGWLQRRQQRFWIWFNQHDVWKFKLTHGGCL